MLTILAAPKRFTCSLLDQYSAFICVNVSDTSHVAKKRICQLYINKKQNFLTNMVYKFSRRFTYRALAMTFHFICTSIVDIHCSINSDTYTHTHTHKHVHKHMHDGKSFCSPTALTVYSSTMLSISRPRYLMESEKATLVNAEENLADSDDNTDYEEKDQDGNTDADRAHGDTDTYVWQDMINYMG
jgi:hypothetical protein